MANSRNPTFSYNLYYVKWHLKKEAKMLTLRGVGTLKLSYFDMVGVS